MKININNFSFSYHDKEIFQDLNIDFKKGKFHGILGLNGSGKTTLLKAIIKLLNCKDDSIYHNKEDINHIKRNQIAKNISYVEQNSANLPKLKVIEYINLSRYLYDDYNDKDKVKVKKVINLLRIDDLKNKYINQLSGGELQKVLIARAIAQETKVIILDEPNSNLDPRHQIEIMNILKNLVKENNITIISTLHDINLALTFCDEVLLINEEEIIQGETQNILNKENIKKFFKVDCCFVTNPLSNNPYIILGQEKILQ